MKILCPTCSGTSIIKDSKRGGKQRYRCKTCGYRFTENTRLRRIDHYYHTKALQLYLEGLGYSGISYVLSVNETTVSRWLQPFAEILKPLQLKMDLTKLELLQQDKTIVTKSLNGGYTSGILFKGFDCEIWGISRKREIAIEPKD